MMYEGQFVCENFQNEFMEFLRIPVLVGSFNGPCTFELL